MNIQVLQPVRSKPGLYRKDKIEFTFWLIYTTDSFRFARLNLPNVLISKAKKKI